MHLPSTSSFFALLSALSAVSRAGETRINCDGHSLPLDLAPVPGFDWTLYSSLTNFCMVTMACQCIGQRVDCKPPEDGSFYPRELRERTDLQRYCQRKCACRDAHMRIGKFARYHGYVGDGLRDTNGYGPSRPAPEEKKSFLGGSSPGGVSSSDFNVNSLACHGGCLSADDCPSAALCGEPVCMVSRKPHSPFFRIGSCMFSDFGSTLGKRAEADSPCYCNSTYISHECCHKSDGIVWELPEARLGAYTPDDGGSEDP